MVLFIAIPERKGWKHNVSNYYWFLLPNCAPHYQWLFGVVIETVGEEEVGSSEKVCENGVLCSLISEIEDIPFPGLTI